MLPIYEDFIIAQQEMIDIRWYTLCSNSFENRGYSIIFERLSSCKNHQSGQNDQLVIFVRHFINVK